MPINQEDGARTAYAFYSKTKRSLPGRGGVSALSFDELNTLYNIALRARRDGNFAKAFAACEPPDGEALPIPERIDAILAEYSSVHGVDIREELYEVKGAEGTVYFKAETDRDAHAYRLGDSITFHITVRAKATGQIVSCDRLEYTYEIEGVEGAVSGTGDGSGGSLTVTVPSEQILSSSFVENGESRGMIVRLSVSAVGVEEQEKFLGGAVVDMDKLRVAAEKPDDFDEYWQKNLRTCFAVSPIDQSVTPYTKGGVVVSDIRRDHGEFSTERGKLITEENYFHAERVDKKKLAAYHAKGMNLTATEAVLDRYDVYEIYLKAPGPCPSTLMMSIPKAAEGNARAFLGFAGYGSHAPSIYASGNVIACSISHNGYWADASDEELYNSLNRGENPILGNYGKANGKPNSNYDDPYDCYLLYLLLRDFQALRFVYELPRGTLGTHFDGVLGEIYSSLSRAWNGKTELSGWSMGGYQSLCVAGLAAKAGIPLSFVRAVIPGFCNLSGHAVGGRFNNVFGIGYTEAMRYLDAAVLAEYIDAYVEIPRCGLGDYTCPPAGIIAAYNAIRCKKKINIYQNATHGYVPADTCIFTREEDPKAL